MSKKLPIVAIIGQTNAGKSALFNRIVGRKESIVAREAGTTRDSVVRNVFVNRDGKTISGDEMQGSGEQRSKTHRTVRRTSSGADNAADRDAVGFTLVDTAGLKNPEDEFEATIQDQIDDAIATADLILLVKNITEPATQSDRNIAKKALKSKKPVILVLNKSDLKEKYPREEYLRLGVKNIVETSAEHNLGITALIREIGKLLSLSFPAERSNGDDRATGSPEVSDSSDTEMGMSPGSDRLDRTADDESNFAISPLKIALIGRPNVGKSHLFNTLAGKQQAIVAPVAGTTRDINRIQVKYHNRNIELLDTAGVRRRGKIEQGVEKFSILRTTAAIEESDICLLLMDVNELNTSVDQSLAGMIVEAGKGIVIVVTKYDNQDVSSETLDVRENKEKLTSNNYRLPSDEILNKISSAFDFIPYAPAILTSSVTGKNVTKIFELATEIAERRKTIISTHKLNEVLQKAVTAHPPSGLKNTYPKLRYIVQTDISPPWFVIHGKHLKNLHWSYKRYLERYLRENFDLIGTPIKFSFRSEK